MVSSVTFPVGLGGDGSTYTDDADPTTGLDNYGYATRLVPMFSQSVAVANQVLTNATAAAASASSALFAPGTAANSTTSVAIATGTKNFTIETGKLYSIGQVVVCASKANPANFMTGQILAHNNTTGALQVSVSQVGGSGTFADWTVSLGSIVSSSLPSQATHANKFLQTDGTSPSWQVALRPSQNLSDVSSVSTSRTNLGLGSLATLNTVNNANWSGTALAVANGGTGSTSAGAARTALGAAASGANSDITSLSALSTALSIAQGGSGATSAAAARTNFGLGTMATQAASAVAITGGTIAGITDLAVADGGTGSSTAAGARSNLGAAAAGANSDITSLSALSTPLSIAQGGTGAADAAAARTALGILMPIGGATGTTSGGFLSVGRTWGVVTGVVRTAAGVMRVDMTERPDALYTVEATVGGAYNRTVGESTASEGYRTTTEFYLITQQGNASASSGSLTDAPRWNVVVYA